jgi:hypothetical protein
VLPPDPILPSLRRALAECFLLGLQSHSFHMALVGVSRESLCQDIGRHLGGSKALNMNLALLASFSYKVISDIYVLGALVDS